MSSANGQVRFEDGTIMHFRFDGTRDVPVKNLYKEYDDMQNAWRKEPDINVSNMTFEPVLLATDYAWGYWWTGYASKEGAIDVFRSIPNDWEGGELKNEETEGLPDWWRFGEDE